MRFILLGSVALVGLAATPTLAADWTGFYAGVYGGAAIRNDGTANVAVASGYMLLDGPNVDPGVNNIGNIDPGIFDILEESASRIGSLDGGQGDGYFGTDTLAYDSGGVMGGVFGYSPGNGWRFEGDWSYVNFGLDSLSFSDVTHQTADASENGSTIDWTRISSVPGGSLPPMTGAFGSSAEFFLASVWYDFDNDTAFAPYIGAGAGIAHVHTTFDGETTGAFVAAGQVGAGLRVDLNETSFLDFGYRYKVAGNDGTSVSGFTDDYPNDTTYTFEGYQVTQTGLLAVQTLQLGYNMIFQ